MFSQSYTASEGGYSSDVRCLLYLLLLDALAQVATELHRLKSDQGFNADQVEHLTLFFFVCL